MGSHGWGSGEGKSRFESTKSGETSLGKKGVVLEWEGAVGEAAPLPGSPCFLAY